MNKIFILPSLFTVGNLCCGLFSLAKTINLQFSEAAWTILIAIFLDMADGKVARLSKTTSNFGKELDSLADVVTFGVAPSILLYEMALKSFHDVGLVISMIYVVCGTLRLARFNVQTTGSQKQYFVGLPIPAAAGMLAICAIWSQEYGYYNNYGRYIFFVLPFLIILLSCLMVSRIKYPVWSKIVTKQSQFVHLVATILGIGLIFLYPLNSLTLLAFFYLITGGWLVKLMEKGHEIIETEHDMELEVIEEEGFEKSH